MQNFDIFIPCAPKDHHKIPFVMASIQKHLTGYEKIFLVSPTRIDRRHLVGVPIPYYEHTDQAVLNVDRRLWKFRPNWCYQQHLKLFQELTSGWYLTLDSDVIFNRHIDFWNGDKPIWWVGAEQNYEPYFIFNQCMIGLPRIAPHTFIADFNLFNRQIIWEMLKNNDYDISSFCQKSQMITRKECCMAEPEIYGNYCHKYHPDMYEIRQLKTEGAGRMQNLDTETQWDHGEIEAVVKQTLAKDVDTIHIHSWYNEGAKL